MLSNLIQSHGDNNILDYCAGSGGKSIAIYNNIENIVFHLYDKNTKIL